MSIDKYLLYICVIHVFSLFGTSQSAVEAFCVYMRDFQGCKINKGSDHQINFRGLENTICDEMESNQVETPQSLSCYDKLGHLFVLKYFNTFHYI